MTRNQDETRSKNTHTIYDRKDYFKNLTDEELDVLEALAKKAIIESIKSNKADTKPTIKPT